VALDGKEPKHSGGQQIVSAVNVPDLYYLGSEMIQTKTNEIPVARALMGRLDLEGRLVGLDALHTQQETAREIVQEAGGDYLLTVKKNQRGIHKTLAQALADIPASFSPWTHHADACLDRRDQSGTARAADAPLPPLLAGASRVSGSGTDRQNLSQDIQTQTGNPLCDHQSGTLGPECRAMVGSDPSVLGH
jgi:hypothetical protein